MPSKRTTTVALAWAPTLTSSWRAMAASPPRPVTVTRTGSASSVSAGTSTVKTCGEAAQTRAATRSVGTKPDRPRSESATSTLPAVAPAGSSILVS